MINWFDMPAEGLSNGGLFEVKELEVTENGTYETKGEMYNKVTVNVEGGGGESWQTVFEGSATTVNREGFADGLIGDFVLTANAIKVTFNGTEYTCERNEDDTYGAENIVPTGYDFSEYPFCVTYDGILITPNAGTYTLKIEEQSGGSSDFSTAEVSVTYNSPDNDIYAKVACVEDNTIISGTFIDRGTTKVLTVPVTGDGTIIDFDEVSEQSYVISGDIESIDTPNLSPFLITGDCTITIS